MVNRLVGGGGGGGGGVGGGSLKSKAPPHNEHPLWHVECLLLTLGRCHLFFYDADIDVQQGALHP